MFYWLFYAVLGINLFKYITFRLLYATMTAIVAGFFIYPRLKKFLDGMQFEQTIKEFMPETHKKKRVPTMGGVLILSAFTLAVILWNRLDNLFVWLVLFSAVGFGLIGFVDDYIKAKLKNPEGLSEKKKLICQIIVSFTIAVILYASGFSTVLYFPVFKHLHLNLGILFILWVIFVIVGASNAVNLTDGLDGLAIGPVITTSLVFLVYAYVAGHARFSSYLHLPYISGAGELSIVCGAVIGASLVFLWFNTYPAEVFMGDVGSLALGAILGTVAVIVKQEFVLAIAGGVFVMETISVIIQRLYFKYTKRRFGEGRRVFLMAPIHHHFEKKGWEEPKITVRFWIISILLALVSLSFLKIR
ncbi:phospho-N-acetylmuramoyl-pentapeptide-transferase [Desulfurobacterium atlanticum]|uniref:Phospho-N-acetylmuramoyl-pentapeptide-transferase n=1 Tax=Desulfurobacterium atlanticum TaxID=240169 RepID=A0A238ZHI7_9BACT|nr:phospho-N-acetylmuramoyl-pentapeptide-transferase [Desulfurobacterium atlanticum]SNR82163.1 Phospho-N-acetylmuramoyl-pentapeptide-transferase [Desulfurobacterium atlanticum]